MLRMNELEENKIMVNKIKKFMIDPKARFNYLEGHGFYRLMDDKRFLKRKWKIMMGSKLNLDNPRTFNEKLQWLKLYDRKDIYTKMVDKYEAKKYVADIIGKGYIIPTIGIYDKFDDINFSELPNQFVIKCTHNSGGLVIVKDKKKLDIKGVKRKINRSLKRKYYYHGREWPYKNVKPRIIIEKYMEDENDGELRDYKLFCFNGRFEIMFIATNRHGDGDTYFDFFDRSFKHLPFTNGHPNAPRVPHKPQNFNKMIKLAERLSKNIPQVRVDFYDVDGKIYFGEMTFSHWSGMMPFDPEEWDEKLGDLIDLDLAREK